MIMQDVVKNRELVSALADGQLRAEEFARTLEWLDASEDARLTWHSYHLVGEVLRSDEPLISGRDAAFMQRLKLRLEQEAPLMPHMDAIDLIAGSAISTGATGIKHSKNGSANDTRFRWKLVAGLASLAAVTVIGWQVSGGGDEQREGVRFAQGPVQTVTPEVALPQVVAGGGGGGEPQPMIRDPQLDALLAAHRQFGGTSALQVPAGFLRNATFEGAAR